MNTVIVLFLPALVSVDGSEGTYRHSSLLSAAVTMSPGVLRAATINRLTVQWQDEARVFADRDLSAVDYGGFG